MTARDDFTIASAARRDQMLAIAQKLIATPSPNPPGDTRAVAQAAADLLREAVPDAEIALHATSDIITNLTARVQGAGAGRRLLLNGHLDTYPVNEALPWTVDPLGGVMADGKLYGRGASDMKGGIAASMTAFALLAEHRALWRGELVLSLGGDEESMGTLGAQWMIENLPYGNGDAVIIGDAGSPRVLRFGEKGFLWVELEASGKPSHGAHVHLGISALDRLREAVAALEALRLHDVPTPAAVAAAIAASRPISEPLSGKGESEVLARITVNTGYIHGGTSMNLVPASARAGVDIRLPVGVTAVEAEAMLAERLGAIEGISWRVLRRVEPRYTDPDAEIVRLTAAAAGQVTGQAPAVNMRVGGSDARLFRAVGTPTVVYGPTPCNMGGADEHALVEELDEVMRVHALVGFDFLAALQKGRAVGS